MKTMLSRVHKRIGLAPAAPWSSQLPPGGDASALSADQVVVTQFLARAVREHMSIRLIPTLGVGIMSGALGLLPLVVVVPWLLAALGSEVAFLAIGRRFERRAPDLPPQAYREWRRAALLCSAAQVAAYNVPVLLTWTAGPLCALIGLMFAAASLMIAAAQLDLSRRMFLLVAPIPAVGLCLNLMPFGHGLGLVLLIGMALGYVANAWHLQRRNVQVTWEKAVALVDAERANAGLRSALTRAEDASAAKSSFLANMSHEIRTPLNGVLGMAQALAHEPLSPSQREKVDIIQGSGRLLMALLNDVLDLSKIEAGRLTLESIPFVLGDLVDELSTGFAETARAKGVGFLVQADESARGGFQGDPVRVRQILFNLVSNALKFTLQGQVTLSLSYAPEAGLRISVRDTGVGIPADVLPGLFAKFNQGDNGVTRRFGGTGLGLAICRELTELMGGAITVESVEGRGSSFHVALPLEPASAPDTAADAASLPVLPPGLRVLAADDNPINQLVLKALLGAVDVSPVLVDDGRQVVEAWAAGEFDLILMDVQMPTLDGLAATGEIRAREAATGRARTPILALTANVMVHQVQAYLDAGMDGHVGKPIEAGELLAAMGRAVAPPNAASPTGTRLRA